MKKIFTICVLALSISTWAHATITCNFIVVQIDSNQTAPIDVDGDGTNDYLLHAQYTPYINNFITGVSGNEIEVTAGSGVNADRARRIESGDPVGAFAWNDTAYMIKGGQGAFSGGTEEYGHLGLRLNKNGNYHYAFLEIRAPYWQAFVAVYTRGYNDVALAETRTDACPHPVGIDEQRLTEANAYVAGRLLHVSLHGDMALQDSEVQLFNAAGQVVYRQNLQQNESDILLNGVESGVYIVAIRGREGMLQRKKVVIL